MQEGSGLWRHVIPGPSTSQDGYQSWPDPWEEREKTWWLVLKTAGLPTPDLRPSAVLSTTDGCRRRNFFIKFKHYLNKERTLLII